MMNMPIMACSRLVCFNNFYYCRSTVCEARLASGQYALIISTIVDQIQKIVVPLGQYALIISTIVDPVNSQTSGRLGLVCFNNFYYCRSVPLEATITRLVCFNNFYYCRSVPLGATITRLVCFNNFYYCRLVIPQRSPPRLVCFNNFYYCRYYHANM